MINEVDAELLGLYMLLITYGVYLVVFYQSILTFRRKSIQGSPVSLWLQGATWLIFIIATFHLVTSGIRAWQAFSFKPGNVSNAVQVFRGVASLPSLLKNGSYIGQTILTDAIMVYRTYVVWGLSWTVVVVPICILCADIAIGTWSMWTLAHTGVNGDPIVAEVVVRVKYFYIVTLALNVLCAGLIAWRIWSIESEARNVTGRDAKDGHAQDILPLGKIINIIVESGKKYPKVQTSIMGTVQFVRRTGQTTTMRHDTTNLYESRGDTHLSEGQHEVRLDLEAGVAHYYKQSSSRSVVIEKVADEKPETQSLQELHIHETEVS
ncbi:hypothetical protein EIP86_009240 [Pleurotus ostreatoroseus]|nr:hypothetical protein EIP86_009240 [Pleurotus ostreatoroseus]